MAGACSMNARDEEYKKRRSGTERGRNYLINISVEF
jgi:hypothetical protein